MARGGFKAEVTLFEGKAVNRLWKTARYASGEANMMFEPNAAEN